MHCKEESGNIKTDMMGLLDCANNKSWFMFRDANRMIKATAMSCSFIM